MYFYIRDDVVGGVDFGIRFSFGLCIDYIYRSGGFDGTDVAEFNFLGDIVVAGLDVFPFKEKEQLSVAIKVSAMPNVAANLNVFICNVFLSFLFS